MSAQQPSRIEADTILQAPIDSIIPNPRQPRRAFREDDPKLRELSDSIAEHGLLQPLVVTRLDAPTAASGTGGADSWFAKDEMAGETSVPVETANGETANGIEFQIIAGERRWRAARLAGLTKVPVVIREA